MDIEADCYVVIDLLRATTTIATLFERGLKSLVAVDDISRARLLAAEGTKLLFTGLSGQRPVLFGEIGGRRPEGFAHGNSPLEASEADIGGREAILVTSNGTQALCTLADHGQVAAGAIANASAIARWAAEFDRVVLVCAGTAAGRRFGLDDFAAAGVLVNRLVRLCPGIEVGDAAGLAMSSAGYDDWLASAMPQQVGKSARLVTGSEHARYLVSIGFGRDVHFAVQEDTSSAVPVAVGCGPGWAVLEDRR